MSIWTNRTAALLAGLTLSACAGMDLALPSRAVTVQGGAIKVAPPAGYCSNPAASTDSAGSAVVLMGRCSAASTSAAALITASVGAEGSGAALDAGPVALTSFFSSDQGRGMLAASGKASDAVVQASESEEGALVLKIKDASLGEYWRGILAVKGRLVMLSATGAEAGSLPPADGRALLSRAMTNLRKANPEAAAKGRLFAAQASAPANTEASTSAPAASPAPAGALRPKPRAPTSG